MKASHLFATADVSALADPQPVLAAGLLAIKEYVNVVPTSASATVYSLKTLVSKFFVA
jgi:hypothetical protein